MTPTRPAPDQLAAFLAPFDDDVRAIVLALRARVLAVLPNAHEVVWDATNAVSLAYTPTERWQDGICHIAVYTRHVNLGFNDGASLEDPRAILCGTGARIRHVSFAGVAETDARWIPSYLRAALEFAGVPPDAGDGGTTVRASKGAKRRPLSP